MKSFRAAVRDPLVLATAVGCALWIVIALTHWSQLIGGVSIGSPWGRYNGQFGETPLFPNGVELVPIFVTAALYALAAAIGYGFVTSPIWGRRGHSDMLLLIAGAAPGTLAVIAVSRLITLAAPHAIAPWLVWGVLLALAAAALLQPGAKAPKSWRITWREAGLTLAACLGLLLFQVHFDGFHTTGGRASGASTPSSCLRPPGSGRTRRCRWSRRTTTSWRCSMRRCSASSRRAKAPPTASPSSSGPAWRCSAFPSAAWSTSPCAA
jgi:hypothetical protein